MDIEEEFILEHLLFKQRKCKTCGKVKDLMTDFYLTRKDRGGAPSAYSYECKVCTIDRAIRNRMQKGPESKWEYPDW